MSGFNFSGLSETDFERFTFDLVAELGFVNVSWRKGTAYDNSPADSGRDIVCQQLREDIDKTKCFETWFLECKHCKKGISPSQLQNLLTWAQAERPHTAVIVASGFLSNPAKDYLENYRRNQKPAFRIKYWEHPDLQRLAAKKPLLIQKYGLVPAQTRPIEEILQQKQEFDRMQATYAKKGIPSNGCKMRMLTAKRLTLGWVLGENRDIPAD